MWDLVSSSFLDRSDYGITSGLGLFDLGGPLLRPGYLAWRLWLDKESGSLLGCFLSAFMCAGRVLTSQAGPELHVRLLRHSHCFAVWVSFGYGLFAKSEASWTWIGLLDVL